MKFILIASIFIHCQLMVFCQIDTIEVGMDKTTFVDIKNCTIKKFDIGNSSCEGKIETSNIFKIKALERFNETNLVVIFSQPDTLIEYNLKYCNSPKKTTYHFNLPTPKISLISAKQNSKATELSETKNTIKQTETKYAEDLDTMYYESVRNKNNPSLTIDELSYEIKFSLIKMLFDKENDVVYFQFRLYNNSRMYFNLDFVKFEVYQKRKLFKKESVQSVYPSVMADKNNVYKIELKKPNDLVFALNKIMVRSDETLRVIFYEKPTETKGRQIKLIISSAVFNRALKQLKK